MMGQSEKKSGPVRDLNPGPLAPKARIIPLDQLAISTYDAGVSVCVCVCVCLFVTTILPTRACATCKRAQT